MKCINVDYDVMTLLEVAKILIFSQNRYDFRNQRQKRCGPVPTAKKCTFPPPPIVRVITIGVGAGNSLNFPITSLSWIYIAGISNSSVLIVPIACLTDIKGLKWTRPFVIERTCSVGYRRDWCWDLSFLTFTTMLLFQFMDANVGNFAGTTLTALFTVLYQNGRFFIWIKRQHRFSSSKVWK